MKVHISLATGDLNASVAFFRTLLAAEATKHYSDYALFVTENPGLELSLTPTSTVRTSDGAHYGIAVDQPAGVDSAIARLEEAGQRVDIERSQTCCYALQTKVWATDPDGRRWETYYVQAESEEREDEATDCCGNDSACCGQGRAHVLTA